MLSVRNLVFIVAQMYIPGFLFQAACCFVNVFKTVQVKATPLEGCRFI